MLGFTHAVMQIAQLLYGLWDNLAKLTVDRFRYIIICVNRIKIYPFLNTGEVLSLNPL